MKNRIVGLSKQEWLTFLGVFLITIGDYFCYSWIDVPYRHILGVPVVVTGTVILLIDVIKNIKEKVYTPKQLKTMGIIILVGALVWHRIQVFYTAIVIALHFVNKDLKFLFKSLFISMLFGMALIMFLNLINVIPDRVLTRVKDGEVFYRYCLGFRQPNVLYRYYIAMVMCGAIALKNNRWFLIIAFILGLGLYKVTYSRMGLVMLFLLIFVCILPKAFRKKAAFNKLIPCMFIGGLIVSIIVAIAFHNNETLNDWLSTRPMIWYEYLKDVGLLGRFRRIQEDMPLDNIYLHILSYGGVYGVIAYIALFFVAFNKFDLKNGYNTFMIFFISLAYGFIENFSAQNENMLLILLIVMLLDKNKLAEIEDDYEYEKSPN